MPYADLKAQSEINLLKGTGGAVRVGYTPDDGANWDPDPSTVSEALDDLASRVVDAIVPTAAEVTYTPDDETHWPDPDPTTAEEAFDDLADRVNTLETATIDATGVDYTPGDGANWNPDPTKVDGALDDLADRLTGLEAPIQGTITYVEAPDDAETITVTVDGVAATLTMTNLAGGNTARTGANAATVDYGGGAGDSAATLMRELYYALALLRDVDGLPVVLDAPAPLASGFYFGHADGLRVKARTSLVLARSGADAGVTVENPV